MQEARELLESGSVVEGQAKVHSCSHCRAHVNVGALLHLYLRATGMPKAQAQPFIEVSCPCCRRRMGKASPVDFSFSTA